MKTFPLRIFLCLNGLLPIVACAQTYHELYAFSVPSGHPSTNSDGIYPFGALILSNNILYGTTEEGGAFASGAIYSINTNGSQFTNLYSFPVLSGGVVSGSGPATNSAGAEPTCPLLLSDGVLYGTAFGGGTSGYGSIFRINVDGSAFTNLHNFSDGQAQPRAQLIISNNVLYGGTPNGGIGFGSVFRINIDGTGFTNLVNFPNTTGSPGGPYSGLVLANGTLYGNTETGGTERGGTLFAVDTNGKGFTNLFTFQPPNGGNRSSTNVTGALPFGTLLLSGGLIYGTTELGGSNDNGVIFSISTNGSSFTTLHNFSIMTGNAETNADGSSPSGALLLENGVLYGTALGGGTSGHGVIYSINTNGAGFQTVYNFHNITNVDNVNVGGWVPNDVLLLSGSTLLGVTTFGGLGEGNIYTLDLSSSTVSSPILNFQVIGGHLVLSWDDPTFSLQSATTLGATFATIPSAPSPYTTNFTGSAQFFRLIQN